VEQQRSPGAGAGLGEHLGRQHPEREAPVDDLVRQVFRRDTPALDDRVEADLLRVAHPLVEVAEGVTLVQVREMHDMAGGAKVVREGTAPGRQPVRMVEEQDLRHAGSLPRYPATRDHR
jgi:hypothetical protein